MSERPPAEFLLVHGDERFLVDREAREWLAAARRHCVSELNVEVIESPSRLDQVRRSLAEVPFLDARRYLLIRDPPQLAERTRRGAEGAEALAAALADRAPTTSLCLAVHGQVPPANPVLKAVQGHGGRVSVHPALRGRDLRDWLDRRLRERGLRLGRGAVDHLLVTVGPDLGRLENELDKLVAYADGRTELEDAAVRRVVGESEPVAVWDVVEQLLTPPHAAGAGALEALLAEGVAPQYLISILAGRFRELIAAAELLRTRGGGAAMVAGELGLSPWRAERLVRWAAIVDPDTVEIWLRDLQEVDAASKAGEASDANGLRALALKAAGYLQARR